VCAVTDRVKVKCKGCGMEIEFIESQKTPGKSIPAQQVRVIYQEERSAGGTRLVKLRTPQTVYVNHFETCPKAKDFSRRGK
jgi:hypothetical protein